MTVRSEVWLTTPRYSGRVRIDNGRVSGGMAQINWAYGTGWDWLLRYLEERWPGQVKVDEMQGDDE